MLENNDQHDFIYTGRDILNGDEETQSTDVDMDTDEETGSEKISRDEAIAWRFIMENADIKEFIMDVTFVRFWR